MWNRSIHAAHLFQYGTLLLVVTLQGVAVTEVEKYILNDKVFLDGSCHGKLYHFIPVYESDKVINRWLGSVSGRGGRTLIIKLFV